MSIYYQDDQTTLHHGDAATVLATLPSGSVDCIVTSPPYFGLRDYGVDGQIGAEASPAEFVAAMVAVFREARRVLADDGTLWLNLGDSYSGSWGNQGRKTERGTQRPITKPMMQPVHDGRYGDTNRRNTGAIRPGMPPAKNLMGIPWRVAFALQDDGWILRNDIIWAKPNAMPESVTDRLSSRHEHLFILTKSPRYWFDLDPIREAQSPASVARATRADKRGKEGWADAYHGNPPTGLARRSERDTTIGRNPGDVWDIATRPAPGAHFAVMPPALAERCIKAGCKPYGTVLDPFSGSGTTGYAAAKHGRRYVGIDLSADYLDLSLRTRLAQPTLQMEGDPA